MDHPPAPPGPPIVVVVMGVSGTGKTAIGQAIAERTGWVFAEGDDFHLPANVEKMRAGHPLTDEDRWPWLRDIAAWIGAHADAGAIVACSALRRPYRDLLRDGHPRVRFIHLLAAREELERRVSARSHSYMPASLLDSQLETLEPLGSDEPGVALDQTGQSVEQVADRAVAQIREWTAAQ